MKDKSIHMHGVENLEDTEFLWVLIHEFAHYFDIYKLGKSPFWDISDDFYSISWQWVKSLLPWSKQSDFVSGYAMTNKYEDFAESYTYYVFHNEDFSKKTENNTKLMQKYRFLEKYAFIKKDFFHEDFSINEAKDYYWDITKIPFDNEKFLQYLRDEI